MLIGSALRDEWVKNTLFIYLFIKTQGIRYKQKHGPNGTKRLRKSELNALRETKHSALQLQITSPLLKKNSTVGHTEGIYILTGLMILLLMCWVMVCVCGSDDDDDLLLLAR